MISQVCQVFLFTLLGLAAAAVEQCSSGYCKYKHLKDECYSQIWKKSDLWCRTLDKKENDDDGIPDTSVVCCAESWDECCEVDSLIVAVIVLCLLGAMGFAVWYLGKCPPAPERPLCEYVELAYDDLCHSDHCMSRKYKLKVGIDKREHGDDH